MKDEKLAKLYLFWWLGLLTPVFVGFAFLLSPEAFSILGAILIAFPVATISFVAIAKKELLKVGDEVDENR